MALTRETGDGLDVFFSESPVVNVRVLWIDALFTVRGGYSSADVG